MSFLFGFNSSKGDRVTTTESNDASESDKPARTQVGSPGELFRDSPSVSMLSETSSKSYRIKTEHAGERDMTENEVSELVQKALKKARKATSPKKKPLYLSPSQRIDPSGTSSWSSVETTPSQQSKVKSPAASFNGVLADVSTDESDSRRDMHALLAPTYDSIDSGIRSHNSGDSVIRKVEEEIEHARKAAEDAGRRLAGAMSSATGGSSWSTAEIINSPTEDLAAILDEHLGDDADLREDILDVSHVTANGVEADSSFRGAQDSIDAEFVAPSIPNTIVRQTKEKPVSLSYIPPHEDDYTENERDAVQLAGETQPPPSNPYLSTAHVDEDAAVEVSVSVHETSILVVETETTDRAALEVYAATKAPDIPMDDSKVKGDEEPGLSKEMFNAKHIAMDKIEAELDIQATFETAEGDVFLTGSEKPRLSEEMLKAKQIAMDKIEAELDIQATFETAQGDIEDSSFTDESEYTEVTVEEEEFDTQERTAAQPIVGDDDDGVYSEYTEETVSEGGRSEFTEEILEAQSGDPVAGVDIEAEIAAILDTPKARNDTVVSDEQWVSRDVMEDADTSDGESKDVSVISVKVEVTHTKKEETTTKTKSVPTLWWTKPDVEDDKEPEPTEDQATRTAAEKALDGTKEVATGRDLKGVKQTNLLQETEGETKKKDDAVEAAKGVFGSRGDLVTGEDETKAERDVGVIDPVEEQSSPSSDLGPESPDSVQELYIHTTQSNKIEFRYPYPTVAPMAQPRSTSAILKENACGHPDRFSSWSVPKPELAQLLLAAQDDSLARRGNACGALKILSLKKRNQLTLVRNKGFLDALIFVMEQKIPYNDREVALDARGRAVATLLNVCAPKDNRTLIMAHPGLANALVKIMKEDDGETRVHACGALATLAKTPMNREAMAAVVGLLDTLSSVLMGKPGQPVGMPQEEKKEDSVYDGTQGLGSSSFSSSDDESGTVGDGTADTGDIQSYGASSSVSSVQQQQVGSKGVSIREIKDGKQNEFLSQARLSACATLSHLSKHTAISDQLKSNRNVLESLIEVSREFDSPIHTKCAEILCNLTRLAANNSDLARNDALVDTLVKCGKSKLAEDRLWAMRTFQNISADTSSKMILANSRILTLLSICAMRRGDEQAAAVAAIYNLSTEPGAVVPLTNTRNVVATLVHLAHDNVPSAQIRFMACDALATIGLWLQTLAGSGTVPEGVPKVLLPTHKTTGWQRWN